MNHPAELKVHSYLNKARKGEAGMSEGTIKRILTDMEEAIRKQFSREVNNKEFSLRMSNVGRPTCQLWFDKNRGDEAEEPNTTFLMNMMLGDIVEAVFKGILTEAGVEFEDGKGCTLTLGKHKIHGTPDLTMDGKVDDIKSASHWAYTNKFESFHTLQSQDSFGYVGQLVGYATAMGVDVGGWWVINKSNGEFKYVSAAEADVTHELNKLQVAADKVTDNKFDRCYEPIAETFRGKKTGNIILGKECGWCKYKMLCYPEVKELPSIPSSAKTPPMVNYIHIEED